MTHPSTRFAKQEGFSGLLDNHSLNTFVLSLSESELLILDNLLSKRLARSRAENDRFSKSEAKNFQSLSSRENQILTLIAKGYTRPEVADVLQISPNTAATHIASIYRKLDISSVAEATLHACRWGLII